MLNAASSPSSGPSDVVEGSEKAPALRPWVKKTRRDPAANVLVGLADLSPEAAASAPSSSLSTSSSPSVVDDTEANWGAMRAWKREDVVTEGEHANAMRPWRQRSQDEAVSGTEEDFGAERGWRKRRLDDGASQASEHVARDAETKESLGEEKDAVRDW